MKKIFKDYCKIYKQYPKDMPLNKKQKKKKHQMIVEWKKTKYEDKPDFMETINFMNQYTNIPYIMPFLQKVLIPPLAKDVLNHQVLGLKLYFELMEDNYFNINRDPILLLEEELDFKVTSFQIANMVLSLFPNHLPTLLYKYKLYAWVLDYSVHEVPTGILVGLNGADLDSLFGLNMDLQAFEKLSKQLGKYQEDKNFITYCTHMYQAYEYYLKNIEMYCNFEECLEKLQIKY